MVRPRGAYVSIPTLTDDGNIEASFAAAEARQVCRIFSTMSDVACGGSLATIAGLIARGQVTLPPMRTLPLEQAAQAHIAIQTGHVRGKIVLNVSYSATAGLLIKNDLVSFSARFGGTPFEVRLPIAAVLGVYARETGQGMIFSDEDAGPPAPPTPPKTGGDEPKRPQLKVVK